MALNPLEENNSPTEVIQLQRLNHGPSFTSSQEELDLYFGELKSAVLLIDSSSRLFYANNACFQLKAFFANELTKGVPVTSLISSILLPDSLIKFYECLIGKKSITITDDFQSAKIEKLTLNPIGFEGFIIKITLDEIHLVSTANLFSHFEELPITYFGFDLPSAQRLHLKFLSDNFQEFFPHISFDEARENDKYFLSFFHAEDLPPLLKKINNLKRGKKSVQLEVRMRNQKSEFSWYRLAIRKFDDSNNSNYFLGYLENIDDIKRDDLIKQQLVYETLEEERNRIAMVLHDDIGQQLIALNMYINSIEEHIGSETPEIKLAKETTAGTIVEMKSIIYNLVPPEMDKGIDKILDNFFYRLNETSRHVQFHFKSTHLKSSFLSVDRSYHIFRIVQEFISNALKYSKCSNIYCRFYSMQGHYCLELADDGQGFDHGKVRKGLGIQNMEKRARILGVEFSLQSSIGEGTILTLNF